VPTKEKMIDKTPKGKMMTKKQNNLKAIKKMNKGEKLGQLASCYPKLLKDGLTRDGIENTHNVYRKHHPIKMGIQNGMKTMDHNLTTSSNYHLESIW
jgi:hypothetical protein